MNKINDNRMVPKYRFPEFTDVWKAEQLSNLLDYERPDNYIVKDTNYLTEGTPVLTANKSFILGYTNETFGICNDLPAIIFDDFTVDKKFVDLPFKVKSSAIKILRPKGKDDLKFIFELMSLIRFEAKDHKRYYISAYQNLSVPIPKPSEQQKIASCLSSLDGIITAESQKLEVLKEHKKGLLQNLFPQGGEPIPVFRFKEFEGKWKNVLIGSLIEIKGRIGYRGYTTNDIVEKGKGAITFSPSNIDGNNQLNFEKATYISWDKYYESPEIMLQDGFTVLVKTGSSYGKAVFIKDLPEKTTINPQLVVLKPKNINPKFLFLLVCNSAIQNQIKETVVGGAIPTLSQESISMFEILIPPDKDKKEQEKISETLSSIDELIIAQIQKIEALNLHKKGLLQGLFPTISNEE